VNITLAISSLAGGGAERTAMVMAQEFMKRGHTLSLVTLYGEGSDFYPVPSGMRRVSLGLEGSSSGFYQPVRNNLRRIYALRRAIRDTHPHVTISFIDRMNVLVLLSLLGTRIPVIVTERADPDITPCGQPWGFLRRCLYPLAALLVSISHGVDRKFSWLAASKRAVVHNPLWPKTTEEGAKDSPMLSPSRKHVVALGRLSSEKGFHLLIRAFAAIADENPEWDLTIIGEGPQRQELTSLIASAGLNKRVTLQGQVQNPFALLRQAHLFVMSSLSEGFGNALIEAMACGIAAISFDCPSGPGEILRHNLDGILVPPQDSAALAAAMDRLMNNPNERHRLSTEALKSVERFRVDRIMDQWDAVFQRLLLVK